MQTPVCELLGIEQPIVLAAMVAVPELAAAVSNAGGLGMVTLTWSDPVGDVVRETAALPTVPSAATWFSPPISTVASIEPSRPVCGSSHCFWAILLATSSRSTMRADSFCVRSEAPRGAAGGRQRS